MLRYLPLVLAALLPLACGDDDEALTPPTEDQLVGTWTVARADADLTVSTTVSGVGTSTRARNTTEASDATVTFRDDGTFATEGSLVLSASVAGAAPQVRNVPFAGGGEWRLDGTTLALSGGSFFPNLGYFGVLPTGIDAAAAAEVTAFTPERRVEFVARVDTAFDVASGGRPASTFAVGATQTLTLQR